jgi:hypothetical protein
MTPSLRSFRRSVRTLVIDPVGVHLSHASREHARVSEK